MDFESILEEIFLGREQENLKVTSHLQMPKKSGFF